MKFADIKIKDSFFWKGHHFQKLNEDTALAYGYEASDFFRPEEEVESPFRLAEPAHYSYEDLKKISTTFFYWWWNQPGTNTQEGFDAWWVEKGIKLLDED